MRATEVPPPPARPQVAPAFTAAYCDRWLDGLTLEAPSKPPLLSTVERWSALLPRPIIPQAAQLETVLRQNPVRPMRKMERAIWTERGAQESWFAGMSVAELQALAETRFLPNARLTFTNGSVEPAKRAFWAHHANARLVEAHLAIESPGFIRGNILDGVDALIAKRAKASTELREELGGDEAKLSELTQLLQQRYWQRWGFDALVVVRPATADAIRVLDPALVKLEDTHLPTAEAGEDTADRVRGIPKGSPETVTGRIPSLEVAEPEARTAAAPDSWSSSWGLDALYALLSSTLRGWGTRLEETTEPQPRATTDASSI